MMDRLMAIQFSTGGVALTKRLAIGNSVSLFALKTCSIKSMLVLFASPMVTSVFMRLHQPATGCLASMPVTSFDGNFSLIESPPAAGFLLADSLLMEGLI